MRYKKTLLLMILLLSPLGCVTPPKGDIRPQAQAPEKAPSAPLISTPVVQERIDFLRKIEARKDLSDKERKIAQELLSTYRLADKLAFSHQTEALYETLIRSLFRSLTLLDRGYFEKKRPPDYMEAVTLFAAKRNEIINLYLEGDFKGVIRRSLELKQTFGPDALTTEVGLLFALSLAQEGKLKQAIEIGEGIATRLDQLPDKVQLRAKIARWQLELGNREEAARTFERLTDHQDERLALIRRLQQEINRDLAHPAESEAGSSPPKPGVELQPGQDGYDLDRIIAEARSLAGEHAYGKARGLLLKARAGIEDGPETEIIDRELAGMEQKEEEFEEQKQIRDAYIKKTLETAQRFVEEEKFEEAVSKLDEVKETGDYSERFKALRERAVESRINQERNRAAEIFLKAKKAKDPVQKEGLLKSSYEILDRLVNDYPSSPLVKKVKSHMAVVKAEMDRLR